MKKSYILYICLVVFSVSGCSQLRHSMMPLYEARFRENTEFFYYEEENALLLLERTFLGESKSKVRSSLGQPQEIFVTPKFIYDSKCSNPNTCKSEPLQKWAADDVWTYKPTRDFPAKPHYFEAVSFYFENDIVTKIALSRSQDHSKF